MTDGQDARTADAVPFRVDRSELNVQLTFSRPFWPIANNVSSLYAGLLNHLRDFGLTSHGLRSDVGDGSLGSFNVNFWLLQFGLIVRIRLDGVELNAPSFNVDLDQLEAAFLALDRSLHEVDPEVGYGSYAVTIGMQGRVEGVEGKEYLGRFAAGHPQGLGPLVGTGTVFYFEGRPPATLVSLTADLSAAIAGGVYVKIHTVFDGTLNAQSLRHTVEEHFTQGLAAMGLRNPAGNDQ